MIDFATPDFSLGGSAWTTSTWCWNVTKSMQPSSP